MNLATSVGELTEVSNNIQLAPISENFTTNSIAVIRWLPGHYNISDGMTKENITTAAIMLRTM